MKQKEMRASPAAVRRETPQMRYQRKWRKDYKFVVLTHLDADIIERMESLDNKSGYLKELIRRDIKNRSAS